MQQHAGKPDPLRLAARQLVDHRVTFERHVDQFQFFLDDLAALVRNHAISRGEEFQVLDDRHVFVHAEEVRHETDQPSNLLGVGVDRFAADVRLAIVGLQQRREHAHGRRLARTIRADEPEDIPFLQVQIDVVHSDQFAITLRKLPCFDHCGTVLRIR